MQFLQICVYPQDIAGAEGPKTGMFAIFGQVLKDPKTGILTMVENCTGGKVQKWFSQNVGSFVKRITFIDLSYICY